MRPNIWLGALPSLLLATAVFAKTQVDPPQDERHRLFVLSDIDAEVDDTQSLVRLLLYSNEIDIEGLVATTSVWKRDSVAPEAMHRVIDAYGKVLPNLHLHDPAYPDAARLDALVTQGQPRYGMTGVGKGMDSTGSEALIRELEQDDDRPLWVTAWGGVSTLAQALYTLRATRPKAEVERLVRKLRVYTISDQDDAGPWLRKEFPDLFYIVSPGGNYWGATWMGMMAVVDGADNSTISNGWLARNIQQGHGPMGAVYPDVAWGMEGDTPSFLALIPNGLNVPERPDWGGWGGRYQLVTPPPLSSDKVNAVADVIFAPETRPIWTDTHDAYGLPERPEFGRSIKDGKVIATDGKATLWRWRDAVQNDFAARMDWTVKPYGEANHAPVVHLEQPTERTAKSGEAITLSARGSYDPDGDSLTYYWFHYPEAGSYAGTIDLGAANADIIHLTAPQVAKTETLHLILTVTDKGAPTLTRYKRIILTVTP